MGWDTSVPTVLKRAANQHPASATWMSLDFALFYGALFQLLLALVYICFHSSYTGSRWDFGKLRNSRRCGRWSVPHSVAWMFFEIPSLLIPVLVILWTKFCHGHALNLLVLVLFTGHYVNRSIIYPLLARKYARDTPDRNVPFLTVLAGFLFTTVNGTLQSFSASSFRYIREARGFMYVYAALCQYVGWEKSVDFFQTSQASAQDILAASRFAAGFALFCWGMWTNIRSDFMLLKLRGLRHFEQRCEYSVPLPSTRRTTSARLPAGPQQRDTHCDTTSAISQERKRRHRTAFNSCWQRNAANARKNSAVTLAEDTRLQNRESVRTAVMEKEAEPFERTKGMTAPGRPLSAVYHTFTRYPASVYKIPRGNWFDYVSCANYFGEVCEWIGFAVMSDTYAAFSFACFSMAFLTYRAMAAHKCYANTFGEQYPPERKAIFPGIL